MNVTTRAREVPSAVLRVYTVIKDDPKGVAQAFETLVYVSPFLVVGGVIAFAVEPRSWRESLSMLVFGLAILLVFCVMMGFVLLAVYIALEVLV